MDTVPDDPIVSDAKILSEFKPLSEADILALIQKSSKKKCNLDPMPTKLAVESLDHLLPVITKMINSLLFTLLPVNCLKLSRATCLAFMLMQTIRSYI